MAAAIEAIWLLFEMLRAWRLEAGRAAEMSASPASGVLTARNSIAPTWLFWRRNVNLQAEEACP